MESVAGVDLDGDSTQIDNQINFEAHSVEPELVNMASLVDQDHIDDVIEYSNNADGAEASNDYSTENSADSDIMLSFVHNNEISNGAFDEISMHEALNMEHGVRFILDHSHEFDFDMRFDINSMINKLKSSVNNDERIKIITELNRFVLMNSSETQIHIITYPLINIMSTILAPFSNLDLLIKTLRLLYSIVDVFPSQIHRFTIFSSRLLHMVTTSECIDIIEDIIGILEKFCQSSAENLIKKNILSKLIRLIDFVSIISQKLILKTHLHCINKLTPKKFHYIKSSIDYLIQRLEVQYDTETICLSISCLHKLLNIFHNDDKIILKIFPTGCFGLFINLIQNTPSILDSHTFILLLRILTKLCYDYPKVALLLIQDLKIVESFSFKLTGFRYFDILNVDIYDKPDNEMKELVSLISNFYPPLPSSEPFQFYTKLIESYCGDLKCYDLGYSVLKNSNYHWEYLSKNEIWLPFGDIISNKIETAFQNRQNPYLIKDANKTFIINFSTMEQCTLMKSFLNRIRRNIKTTQIVHTCTDPRINILDETYYKMNIWILSLLSNIIKNDISSPLAHKCLIVIIKIIYYSNPNIVSKLVKQKSLVREVALFLKSNSLSIVTSTILLIKLIYDKIHDKINTVFINEGVYEALSNIIDTIYLNYNKNKVKYEFKNSLLSINNNVPDENKTPLLNFRKTLIRLKSRTKYLLKKISNRNQSKCSSEIDTLNNCIIGQQFLTIKDTDENVQWLELEKFLNLTILIISDTFFSEIKNNVNDLKEIKDLNFIQELLKKIKNGEILSKQSFSQLSNVFKPPFISSLTPFQIKQANFVDFLLSCLTQSNYADENLISFIEFFICGYENDIYNSPFYGLIQTLQTYISYIEKLQNPCFYKVSNSAPNENVTNILDRNLKFVLQNCCPVVFKRHPSCNDLEEITSRRINIHPLRTIASIENFVNDLCEKKRVVKKGVDSIKSSDSQCRSKLVESFISRSEENIAQICITMMNDRESNVNTYQNISQSERQVELLINDVPLHNRLTLIQALITHLRNNTSSSLNHSPCDFFCLESLFYGTSLVIQYRLKSKKLKKYFPSKKSKLVKTQYLDKSTSLSHSSNIHKILSDFSVNKIKLCFDLILFKALKLLSILHYINFSWGSIVNKTIWVPFISRNYFCNVNLSMKLSRMVADPFVCLMSLFPQWIVILSELCPFLFDFNLRTKLFTSMGYNFERKLLYYQRLNATFELSNDLTSKYVVKKEYIRVNRESLLEQAEEIFKDTSSKDRILSITYSDESGFGNGPTSEYFSLVSNQIIHQSLKYWRLDNDGGNVYDHYLFPQIISDSSIHKDKAQYKSYFIFLGLFIGRCMLDKCPIDISFSNIFYSNLLRDLNQPYLYMIKEVDPVLYGSLLHLLQLSNDNDDVALGDIGLTFTYTTSDGHSFELCPCGSEVAVTASNVTQFIQSVISFIFKKSVRKQFKWIQKGIEMYFPSFLNGSIFYPEEMESILCGERQTKWSIEDLKSFVSIKQKYTIESPICQILFDILSNFDDRNLRLFLQFVTGKPRLPLGGFSSLVPPLTIVPFYLGNSNESKKDLNPDDFLPTANTCVNTLKLPEYSSKEILLEKLLMAIHEGQEAFLLS